MGKSLFTVNSWDMSILSSSDSVTWDTWSCLHKKGQMGNAFSVVVCISLHPFCEYSLKKLCYRLARCWGNKMQEESAGPDVFARLCSLTPPWFGFFFCPWGHWEFVIVLQVTVVYQSCWSCSRNGVLQRWLSYSGGEEAPIPNWREGGEGASTDAFQRSREEQSDRFALRLWHCACRFAMK